MKTEVTTLYTSGRVCAHFETASTIRADSQGPVSGADIYLQVSTVT